MIAYRAQYGSPNPAADRRTCHFCHRNEYAGSSDILQNYEWKEINELNL